MINPINNVEKLLPILLIIIDFCAAIVYLIKGDIKHGIYWIAAGVLTCCVTF